MKWFSWGRALLIVPALRSSFFHPGSGCDGAYPYRYAEDAEKAGHTPELVERVRALAAEMKERS